MKLVVVGLGKLGSPLAAVLAGAGHDVVGVDLDQHAIDLLNAGRAPVQEPRLQELIDRNRSRLSATSDYEVALRGADASFVIVPTPSTPEGDFSLSFVDRAVEQIGVALSRNERRRHLVVLTSTVMPGSCDGPVRAALERGAGRPLGEDLGLCYSPQFIALGSVIENMTRPDFSLVGESAPWAGDLLVAITRGVFENDPPVSRMNLVNAEVTKLAVNTYVTTKISYANMISEVCGRLPGADVDVVTSAVGSDSRIGRKYLRGATAYGGPCFPRDNAAFSYLARSLGTSADIAEATDHINRRQTARLVEVALASVDSPADARIAILGVAYKPDTAVTEESPAGSIGAYLEQHGRRAVAYDPLGDDVPEAGWPASLDRAESMAACVAAADVVIVTTPCPEFAGLPDLLSSGAENRVVVIDCWRAFDRKTLGSNVELVQLGVGPSADIAVARSSTASG